MKESNGMTFAEVIQIIFIVLKLCGVIEWSWWLVLSPVWISALIVFAGYLLYRR